MLDRVLHVAVSDGSMSFELILRRETFVRS